MHQINRKLGYEEMFAAISANSR